MAFTIPENLPEQLYPLAWLIGTWSGKGHGEFEGVTPFQFAQEVTFNHDGRGFLTYYSRSWIIDDNNEIIKQANSETGFWNIRDGKILDLMLSHSNGHSESWVGLVDGPRIQLELDGVINGVTAKPVSGGHRLYGLVEGELFCAYDMQTPTKELQPHLWATLARMPQ